MESWKGVMEMIAEMEGLAMTRRRTRLVAVGDEVMGWRW